MTKCTCGGDHHYTQCPYRELAKPYSSDTKYRGGGLGGGSGAAAGLGRLIVAGLIVAGIVKCQGEKERESAPARPSSEIIPYQDLRNRPATPPAGYTAVSIVNDGSRSYYPLVYQSRPVDEKKDADYACKEVLRSESCTIIGRLVTTEFQCLAVVRNIQTQKMSTLTGASVQAVRDKFVAACGTENECYERTADIICNKWPFMQKVNIK